MQTNLKVLYHSSIKILDEKIIYFDPYQINKEYTDADYIFITHEHYDHFSPEDILKVKNENTKIIVPVSMLNFKAEIINLGFHEEQIFMCEPNEKYNINDLEFETVKSYNINKAFHPKIKNWLGYIVKIKNEKVYVAGDTDLIEENANIKCDISCIPIGGTYTMNAFEAAEFVNKLQPKLAIPTHYNSIVGSKNDAEIFKENVNSNIKVEIQL